MQDQGHDYDENSGSRAIVQERSVKMFFFYSAHSHSFPAAQVVELIVSNVAETYIINNFRKSNNLSNNLNWCLSQTTMTMAVFKWAKVY